MEDLILKEFEKQKSKAGHILMIRNLNLRVLQNLNPKEMDLFPTAINNLIEKGFVTYEDASSGSECLRLTELGYSKLYNNSLDAEQIVQIILKEFEKQKSKAGHILMMRNLNFRVLQNLNPKEMDLFATAISNLIDKGFVTYEDASSGPECLRLTELGYDNLY